MATKTQAKDVVTHAVIGNIPPDYHSADLRNYFSMFIESGGFQCFHFRHRPEVIIPDKEREHLASQSHSKSNTSLTSPSPKEKKPKSQTTTCCVVRLLEGRLDELMRLYHRKHWLDSNGDAIRPLCVVSGVRVGVTDGTNAATGSGGLGSAVGGPGYKTRSEQKARPTKESQEFTNNDLSNLPELNPPDIMPNGNVGTPTKVFLKLIKSCRLPPKVISKLGLAFPRTRTNKIYSKMAYDYGGLIEDGPPSEEEVVKSASGHELLSECDKKICDAQVASTKSSSSGLNESDVKKTRKGKQHERRPESDEEIQKSEFDSDDCEDWERHEALHDDVAHHVERNKERLFEAEIELKWEKGGSGLVFYTDAQYWDAEKGDFDERTADDWDVDMSIYTDPTAGDKDARDFMAMRQEQRRRAGVEDTDMFTAGIGKFEKHTKGIGRKVLEKQGWMDGEGLGRTIVGMADALEEEGQKPFDRTGFGFHGERLSREVSSAAKRARRARGVIISTVYDHPEETDPPEALYRRNDHYRLTYRHSFQQGQTLPGGRGGGATGSRSHTKGPDS